MTLSRDLSRGIVLSPERIITDKDLIIKSVLDSSELRKALLYWDKIINVDVIPPGPNNIIDQDGVITGSLIVGAEKKEEIAKYTRDTNELHNVSIFDNCSAEIDVNSLSPPVDDKFKRLFVGGFYGSQLLEASNAAKIEVIKYFEENKPEYKKIDWSIGQNSNELILPKSKESDVNNLIYNIRCDLTGGLPIPHPDVEIHEILEFKEKRQSELISFWSKLNEFQQVILNSPDKRSQLATCIENLQQNLIIIDKLLNEKKIKRVFTGLGVFLNSESNKAINVMSALAIALGLNSNDTKSAIISSLTGVGGLLINTVISLKKLPKLNLSEASKDYAYLYYAQKELI